MTQSSKFSTSIVCAVFAFALFAPVVMAKKPMQSVEATITQMEKDSVKADLANDSSWISNNMADNYTAGNSWGAWSTKAEMLKDAADSANNRTNSREISDISVRVYGKDVAISTYRESYDSLIRGEHRTRKIITTNTWVNQNGTWKLAASHSSQADQKIGD